MASSDDAVPAPSSVQTTRRRSPTLAVLLSLALPGVGQAYLGQTAKAVVVVLTFVGCLYGVTEGALFPFLFLLPFVYLVCAIDAHRWAHELNAQALVGLGQGVSARESPWWGAALIALGGTLLLHNLGWLDLLVLQRFWPVVLVAAGVASLYGSTAKGPARPEPAEPQRTPELN